MADDQPNEARVLDAWASPAPSTRDATTGCITCGDVALPLTVLRVYEASGLALCADDAGKSETVEIGLVGPVATGHRLLVHAGTAIASLGA